MVGGDEHGIAVHIAARPMALAGSIPGEPHGCHRPGLGRRKVGGRCAQLTDFDPPHRRRAVNTGRGALAG
jgi:hypothetical protein